MSTKKKQPLPAKEACRQTSQQPHTLIVRRPGCQDLNQAETITRSANPASLDGPKTHNCFNLLHLYQPHVLAQMLS